MTAVMQGVRILEVAEHTFVPAASALLAEWGAEVIKIEHVERGDAMRGLASSGVVDLGGGVHVLLEHSNRGKKSIGLDLATPEGIEVLYKLAASCDVFLTNKTPGIRQKLKIDLDDIRAHNPDIIYVRGHGQGHHGPDADRGSYDSLAYWNRAGIAYAYKQPDEVQAAGPPGPAFGDSIGAMTIAGGIMGALFHRANTGEATEVDVSLLSAGMWSMGAGIALSLQLQMPWTGMGKGNGLATNPLVGNYETKDGREVALTCLQPGKYWAEACEIVGRPELATDERFADAAVGDDGGGVGRELLAEAFKERTAEEWREALQSFSGQWAMVQSTLEVAEDPQALANAYIQDYETAGGVGFKLTSPPIRFGDEPPAALRAPEFNEHGDEILESIGLDMEAIIDLKVKGVVA
jgi:crotonobetainyl-CoA:carnitine CoA-transferase CaiB-like acyl-CoA transferase